MEWHRNDALAIGTLVSIGLLVVAASLVSPPWWLILPGWCMLATCIAIRSAAISHDSPYRDAFILMGVPILFYFGLWEGAFRTLLRLILEPSWQHLFGFLANKSFLVLVILYFVFACVFYRNRLSEERAGREAARRQYEEKFHEARKWRRLAEGSQLARESEEVGNFDCLVTDRVKRELEEYERAKKQPQEMTREELLEENRWLADDNKRLSELLKDEYRAQDES